MSGRGFTLAASLALCLAGAASVTQGVAVPVEARMAQHSLDRVFEQRLAAHVALAPAAAVGAPGKVTAARSKPAVNLALPSHGPVARLSVERLGVREVVLAGDPTPDQLAKGPALLQRGSEARPVTILAAHRDTHFRFIRDLQAGDEVELQLVTGQTERYRVVRFETVRWDEFAYPRDPARPLLALATCYPFDGAEYGGPLRRVAWAERIDDGQAPAAMIRR